MYYPSRAPIVFALFLSCVAHAAPAVFTIDPAQSQITIAGKIAGADLKEQGPGSLTTRFGGTLAAEITGSTIQFTGGSVVDAESNGTWQPGVGGAAGSAPADFAGQVAIAKGAFRNIVLDVTSSLLTLANGGFDASALTFGFPANSTASLDYDLGFFGKGSRALTGLSTNRVTQAATLTTEGDVQKLMILVNTEYKFRALTDNDSVAQLAGQLVATRPNQAPQPLIGGISLTDKKLSFVVEGATANTQVQSSTDLKAWQPRTAERKTEGNKVSFTVEQNAALEFLRVAQ